MNGGNLFGDVPRALAEEQFTELLAAPNLRVERIVSTIFEEITRALARGDRVELRGFGAFSVKKRDARVELAVLTRDLDMAQRAYDNPYVDHRGRRKTSYMLYQQELDQQLLSVFRYDDELDETSRAARRTQIHRTFNPGPLRRMWRGVSWCGRRLTAPLGSSARSMFSSTTRVFTHSSPCGT